MNTGIYFISGIDTEIGKTITTGILAKQLLDQGYDVITQKMVQTGCQTWADDVLTHRAMMNIPLQAVDIQRVTMPQIFTYPASPHLAAALAQQTVNISHIEATTKQLHQQYDIVLLEGAGGLAVPLNQDLLTIDYVAENKYPVILVTCGRLGSINHTLLSLMALQQRKMVLHAVIYNHIHDHLDQIISTDSLSLMRAYTYQYFPNAQFLEIDILSLAELDVIKQRKQLLKNNLMSYQN